MLWPLRSISQGIKFVWTFVISVETKISQKYFPVIFISRPPRSVECLAKDCNNMTFWNKFLRTYINRDGHGYFERSSRSETRTFPQSAHLYRTKCNVSSSDRYRRLTSLRPTDIYACASLNRPADRIYIDCALQISRRICRRKKKPNRAMYISYTYNVRNPTF